MSRPDDSDKKRERALSSKEWFKIKNFIDETGSDALPRLETHVLDGSQLAYSHETPDCLVTIHMNNPRAVAKDHPEHYGLVRRLTQLVHD